MEIRDIEDIDWDNLLDGDIIVRVWNEVFDATKLRGTITFKYRKPVIDGFEDPGCPLSINGNTALRIQFLLKKQWYSPLWNDFMFSEIEFRKDSDDYIKRYKEYEMCIHYTVVPKNKHNYGGGF